MEWTLSRQTYLHTLEPSLDLNVTSRRTFAAYQETPNVFKSMNNIWRSTQYGTNTKLKLYQNCVVSTILFGSECWRMRQTDLIKLCSFHIICLLRILRIFWLKKISNENLVRRREQKDMDAINNYRDGLDMFCERTIDDHQNINTVDAIHKEKEK